MNYELIIGFATMMVIIHRAPLYHRFLEALMLDIKPFTCVLCSTFWLTLGFTLFTNPAHAIFISSSAAVLAEILDIQINKL